MGWGCLGLNPYNELLLVGWGCLGLNHYNELFVSGMGIQTIKPIILWSTTDIFSSSMLRKLRCKGMAVTILPINE